MDRDLFRAGSPSSSRTVLPPDYHYHAPPPHSYPHSGSSTRSSQLETSSSGSSALYTGPPSIAHHGLQHRGWHRDPSHAPPIPPARSSSLTVPASPDSAHRVPTFQLIQPTPTKKKVRRKSAGGGSVSSGSPSLRGRTSTLYVETIGLAEDDEEDSDVAKSRKEEDRKARAREKGRERQRRKRERDKRARDDARGSSSHLPVPPRAHSHSSLTALTATHPLVPHSAPSSVSSTYSSLPFSASHYSLSPSQYGFSTASTSVSGQSSPNVLFSPAISTPGIGYADAVWSNENSVSNLDMTALRSRPKSRGGRNRTSSMSTGASRQPSREPTATSPLMMKEDQHRPEKRRKSVPEPEGLRPEVGLGMIIGGDAMTASWPIPGAQEGVNRPTAQPRPRRTLSDGNVLQQAEEWATRSPTPPPVPSVPAEYRRALPTASTSEKATFFASTILLALGSDANQGISNIFRSELGLGKEELESMRADLAGVYEKWRLGKTALESRMSQVSLEEDKDKLATLLSTSPTVSPPPGVKSYDTFITPGPSRLRHRVASASHIPSLAQESPSTQVSSVRARALSSSSRPIPPAIPPPVQTHWESPAVPQSSADSPTTSSLQTPSTAGQGHFPISDSASAQAWQTTDASQYNSGMDWQYQTAMPANSKPDSAGLESPLTMTKSATSASMGPPPLRDPSSAPASVLHWTPSVPYTPSSRAVRPNIVPFTPPTPMPVKGGEAPMWYQQTFVPGQSAPQSMRPPARMQQMDSAQYAAGMNGMTYPITATATPMTATMANGVQAQPQGQQSPMVQQPDPNAVFGYGYGQSYGQ